MAITASVEVNTPVIALRMSVKDALRLRAAVVKFDWRGDNNLFENIYNQLDSLDVVLEADDGNISFEYDERRDELVADDYTDEE